MSTDTATNPGMNRSWRETRAIGPSIAFAQSSEKSRDAITLAASVRLLVAGDKDDMTYVARR